MKLTLLVLTVLWSGSGARAAEAPPSVPTRVLSGSLASDEIAVELLTRAGALERLLAVSTLADDALYSNIAPVPKIIRGRFGADLEGAVSLRPDLVFLASFNKPETLARFAHAKIRTVVLANFATPGDIAANIDLVGTALALPAEAAALRRELEGGIADVAGRVKQGRTRPKVLDFHPGGTISGTDTLFDGLVRAAGGDNLAAAQGWKGWPVVGAETLATLAPDVIVAAGEAADEGAVRAQILATPGWKSMRSIRTARIVLVPERELSATSHHILKALRRIAAGIAAATPGAGTGSGATTPGIGAGSGAAAPVGQVATPAGTPAGGGPAP